MLCSLVLGSSVAMASPSEPDDLTAAVARTHDDGARVAYHAAETVIAERDLQTARMEMDTAHARWDAAIHADDSDAAAHWAVAHLHAQDAAREAYNRVVAERAERDIARADFRRDAEQAQRAK
ncbi:MAG TPA: hypothetical protein VGO00_10670, partial [Kofleriaceae bacterium]|nr:hypothetical protein [Kofleriaceae bacterium]